MKLIIVRHGETHCNRTKHFESSGDASGSSLTEDGKIQAHLLAKHLANLFSVDFIYSSPTIRTRDTADILKEKLNSPIIIVDELREIDCGEWADKPIDIIKGANAEEWKIWKEKPTDFCFPQGESLLDVESRISPFIDSLLEKVQKQTIVIVSHSAMISVILAYLHKWQLGKAWLDKRSYHMNTAFTVLDYEVDSSNILSSKIASTIHLETV